MKKWLITLSAVLALTGCAGQPGQEESIMPNLITASEAKQMLDEQQGYVLLDVRTEQEYAEGHIPGALLIPNTELSEKAADLLPDKEQTILVYCRSGRRSAEAARTLADMGYTQVYDFGGIIDWPYEVEK